jgi:hypothetical protein
MKRQLLGLVGAIGALLLISGELASQSPPACSADADAGSHLTSWVTTLATASASDTQYVARRTYLGIPNVPANQVMLVTDSTACTAARVAHSAVVGLPASSLSVVVVMVGTRAVVLDPSVKAGEWIKAAVFDSSYQPVSTFLF